MTILQYCQGKIKKLFLLIKTENKKKIYINYFSPSEKAKKSAVFFVAIKIF